MLMEFAKSLHMALGDDRSGPCVRNKGKVASMSSRKVEGHWLCRSMRLCLILENDYHASPRQAAVEPNPFGMGHGDVKATQVRL
jgi:hypothetical protein